jgi:hypothetical protein
MSKARGLHAARIGEEKNTMQNKSDWVFSAVWEDVNKVVLSMTHQENQARVAWYNGMYVGASWGWHGAMTSACIMHLIGQSTEVVPVQSSATEREAIEWRNLELKEKAWSEIRPFFLKAREKIERAYDAQKQKRLGNEISVS